MELALLEIGTELAKARNEETTDGSCLKLKGTLIKLCSLYTSFRLFRKQKTVATIAFAISLRSIVRCLHGVLSLCKLD